MSGTKRRDLVWSIFFTPLFVAVYAVAGLDAGRQGWSSMPGWLWWAGLAIFLPSMALFAILALALPRGRATR